MQATGLIAVWLHVPPHRGRWPRPTRGSRARPARRRFDAGALEPVRHVYTATGTPLVKRD